MLSKIMQAYSSDFVSFLSKMHNGIILAPQNPLKYDKGVVAMAENDPELLDSVYRETSERLGMDTAMEIYQLLKGQQICFPIRFFNPVRIRKCIVQE